MKTSPLYGWPIEEQDDTRRDFPTRVDEPRTLAIEATMADHAQRATATAWREGEASAGAGINVPVTAALTIADAPAGVYLSTCVARAKSLNSTDIYGGLILNASAGGTLIRDWLMELADRYWRVMSASVVHTHTGGSLTVAWNVKFSTGAGVLVGIGSHSTLTRVSP